jgi:hypothetical protein
MTGAIVEQELLSFIVVNRGRKDNTINKRKGQDDKQRSTKHYSENKRLYNTNLTKSLCQIRIDKRDNKSKIRSNTVPFLVHDLSPGL